ncbi:ATP-binding protein [Marinibacterium sp. SX1]|uniref:ATP-binding protein n=1 Tax=Marinibacterium sp. SX1 TaxID=3388424 RepID=UPI003D17FD70
MSWSRLPLSGKLFVAIVLPVLFAILLMAGAVGYSMRAGFSNYLLDAELAQLSALAETLEQHPTAAQGWPGLDDPAAWHAMVMGHLPGPPPLIGPGPTHDQAPPQRASQPPVQPPEQATGQAVDQATDQAPDLPDGQPRRQTPDARRPDSQPPHQPSNTHHPDSQPPRQPPDLRPAGPGQPGLPRPGPLPDRLALITGDGRVVAGGAMGDTHAERILRDAHGRVLGRLRLSQPGIRPEPADSAFLAAQFRAIGLTAAIALLCASAVAWFMARQFLAPIRRIGLHVARLTEGDLSSRLHATRGDELGRMMQDHDTLAERLDAVRRREKQWISDTSHELKTPLSVLRAQIEALQDGIRPASGEALDRMHHAVMRLSRLTDDLSLLSRSDEGRLPLSLIPLDLCALAREAADDLRPRCRSAGLRLLAHRGPALVVRADPVRLRQVIDNLLDNACRYTDRPGRIDIRCRHAGTMAELTVSDTAPCPAPAALPGLFDRFRRGETSRARSHGGSGLGLSICRALLTAQGGTITAAPSDSGGLAVTIQIPLIPAEMPAPRPEEPTWPPKTPTS